MRECVLGIILNTVTGESGTAPGSSLCLSGRQRLVCAVLGWPGSRSPGGQTRTHTRIPSLCRLRAVNTPPPAPRLMSREANAHGVGGQACSHTRASGTQVQAHPAPGDTSQWGVSLGRDARGWGVQCIALRCSIFVSDRLGLFSFLGAFARASEGRKNRKALKRRGCKRELRV